MKRLDQNWKILAVSSETDREKLKLHMLEQGFENIQVAMVAADDLKRARMGFTPMTVALDANGEVVKVWAGLWTKGFDLQ